MRYRKRWHRWHRWHTFHSKPFFKIKLLKICHLSAVFDEKRKVVVPRRKNKTWHRWHSAVSKESEITILWIRNFNEDQINIEQAVGVIIVHCRTAPKNAYYNVQAVFADNLQGSESSQQVQVIDEELTPQEATALMSAIWQARLEGKPCFDVIAYCDALEQAELEAFDWKRTQG